MPIDAVVHAEMKNLMMRRKRAEEELAKVRVDGPMWRKRVDLAHEKGMVELATQAQEKLDALRVRRDELKFELEKIDQERDVLRYQARRPDGLAVERAEHMVEQVRQGGLIDPDRAGLELELEKLATFDFDEEH